MSFTVKQCNQWLIIINSQCVLAQDLLINFECMQKIGWRYNGSSVIKAVYPNIVFLKDVPPKI